VHDDSPPASIAPAVEIRRTRGRDELAAAVALRRAVFCGEQGVPVELELDGRDGDAVHLVAVHDGEVIGTCRVLVDGGTAKLGRLAVVRPHRGRRTGSALVAAAEAQALAAGASRIVLHAQAHATRLYAAHGFRVSGSPFVQAGIEHVTMEKALA
jgi:predicted GNAT family N-acyltransferase